MNIHIINFRPTKIAQALLLFAALIHWLLLPNAIYLYSNKPIGFMVGLIGFSIMLWAWWMFKKTNAAICPTAKTIHLITSGIYRFTRNPMYLGIILMLFSVAIVIGTLPFYLVSVIYFFVINQVFCPYEEKKLTDTFGKDYVDFKKRVRRWL